MNKLRKYKTKKNLILFALFYFLLYKNKNIQKNKILKVCMCTIGKKENIYIKEFVDYYKKLGYNHIFLYDNNDINDERFDEILKTEIKNNFVTIINYRGYKGKKQNPQFDSYKNCYQKNHHNYDWLSFFDIDEYLELNPLNQKIQEFLNQKKFNKCQVIKINWLYYINNNSLYYEDKPLQQRMTKPAFKHKLNEHIKSIVRGNLSNNYWLKANNPHTSINNFIACSSKGNIINSSSPFNIPPEFKFAYIKHYQMKSFEEYCLKIKRGRPVPQYKIYRKKMIKKLFKDNKNNNEKLKILKRIFNITIN